MVYLGLAKGFQKWSHILKKTLCLYSSSFHFPCFQIISYDSPRGGVSVITEKGDVVTSSHLVVQKAKPSDSGNYSCAPSIGQRVAVNVHVLRGKSSRFHLTGCENFNKRKIKVCVSSVLGPLRLAYDIWYGFVSRLFRKQRTRTS